MHFVARKPKVVITGMGAVTPLGVGVAALWEGLCSGRSGVATVRAFDASGFSTDFGGEAPRVDPERCLQGHHRRLRKIVGRKEALGLCAAAEAMAQAGLGPGGLEAARRLAEDVGWAPSPAAPRRGRTSAARARRLHRRGRRHGAVPHPGGAGLAGDGRR